jgi:predicted phage tail protein
MIRAIFVSICFGAATAFASTGSASYAVAALGVGMVICVASLLSVKPKNGRRWVK